MNIKCPRNGRYLAGVGFLSTFATNGVKKGQHVPRHDNYHILYTWWVPQMSDIEGGGGHISKDLPL